MKAWYMSGAGNDFVVIDTRNIIVDMEKTSKELCSVYGADGFMALDNSCIADVKLHFYNSDGSRAEMCGNGARCICRFAFDNGIVKEKMSVETDAGIVFGERLAENIYRVRLNDPQDVELNKKDGIDYAVVGVPHACAEVSELDWENSGALISKAREIRFDPIFEKGANVNFYLRENENTVKILTYERGVEDFTLACGTGSGAVATVLFTSGKIFGDAITVKNKGGDLKISVCQVDGKIESLYLEGNAEILEMFDF